MALFHRPLPRTLPACLRDLSESNPLVRRSAMEDLARFVHPDQHVSITEALMKGLQDSDAIVRMHAAYDLGDARVTDALSSLLLAVDDPHSLVRQAAIDALGALGDSRAMGRLVRALSDERPDMRFQALLALARVDPNEALDAVVRAMSDEDVKVRYIAVRVAEELSCKSDDTLQLPEKIKQNIEQWLHDEDARVRLAVAILLGRVGDPAGREVIVAAVDDRMVILEHEDEAAAVELAGKLGLMEATSGLERRAFGLARWIRERHGWASRVALAKMGHERAKRGILQDLRSWFRTTRNAAVEAAAQAGLIEATDRLEAMRGNDSLADPEAVEAALATLAQQYEKSTENGLK